MHALNNNEREIWPKIYSSKSIWFSIYLLIFLNLLFLNFHTPLGLILLIIFVLVFFFVSLRKYTTEWMELPYNVFLKKIFYRSFVIRIVFFLLMILYTLIYSPDTIAMLEMFPADAWNYNGWGIIISENLFNGNLLFTLQSLFRDSADWGFPLYIGVIYFILFPSVIVIKLLNILWGCLSVVYVSKIARLLYSELHAKITGVIMMIMPSLIWFDVQLLKESLMIFIIVIIFYNAVRIIKKGFKIKNIILVAILSFSLFYFRVALATVVVLSLFVFFVLNITFGKRKKIVYFLVLLMFIFSVIYLSVKTDQLDPVESGYSTLQKEQGLETAISDKISRLGDRLDIKSNLTIPLVIISAFVSPYPTFLNIDYRQLGIIAHSQNELTRIIIIYFAIVAIPFLLKRDLKNSSLILSFVIAYTVILALTANSYEDRYQLPNLPFMIILVSVGLLNLSEKVQRKWNIYLLIIFIIIILWHLFKLSIRGIV